MKMLMKLALVGAVSISLVGCGGGDSNDSNTSHAKATKASVGSVLSAQNMILRLGSSEDGRASLFLHGSGTIGFMGSAKFSVRVSEPKPETLPSGLLYEIVGESEAYSLFEKCELKIQLNLRRDAGLLQIQHADTKDGTYNPIHDVEVSGYSEQTAEDGQVYYSVELKAQVSGPGYYFVPLEDLGILMPSLKKSS
ncbi:hypothetical protein KMZ15_01880 [Mycoavidus sp. HKI]|uniref:hypothetical protein n=1 Tax=Mycoavidus sp. HKI TaxID=2840467 RepID=UPI001CBCD439|nr:hypothetical protein [Mycoavidus sp. HKI]UAW64461.1 hypothetical protein KMZ15_01880 [Mycoavidus sp. HKI]